MSAIGCHGRPGDGPTTVRYRPMKWLVVWVAVALVGCGGQQVAFDESRLPREQVEILVDDAGIPHIYARSDEDLFFAYGYQLASDRLLQLEMFRRFAHGRLSEVLGADGPGSAGATSLVDDRFARIFDWQRWGRMDAEWMAGQEPEHYRLTSAWVSGINQRVDEVNAGEVALPLGFGPAELDFQPERWDVADPYVVHKMTGFGLDQTIEFEVFVSFAKQFAPEALDAIELFKPARPVYTLPEPERPTQAEARALEMGIPSEALACRGLDHDSAERLSATMTGLERLSFIKPLGSNNWAVDGRHTASGMPLLAGDPHLGFDFSGITYALHLNSADAGGSFDVSGFSFAGGPGIFAGHNAKVAWTPTSAFADVMDLWAVELKDGKALIGGQWVDTVARTERIGVRGEEPEEIVVTEVPGYGVIMPSSLVGSPLPIAGGGKEVMVGWTGFQARPARNFRELMRATSLDDFEQAVMRLPEMSYNFVAADASGISYRVGADVPERKSLGKGREPYATMDGSDPAALWTGRMLPADQLPHSRAEERGWIVTANNDPFGFTGNGRLDDDPWYYGAIFPPGWRAARIESVLRRFIDSGVPLTVADMQALQMDVHSGLADDLLPVLEQAYGRIGDDAGLDEFAHRPDLDILVELLTKHWDRRMARDSSGAVAFHAFAHLVTAAVLEDDLSPILYEVVLSAAPMYLLKVATLALSGAYPDGDRVLQDGRDRIVLGALSQTAAWLAQRFGGVEPEAYRFSDVRVSSMDHAFGRGVELFELPTDGGESTVNVAQSIFRRDGVTLDRWVSHWGPIERQVTSFEPDGTPVAYANFPLGNVADRNSAHFDDAMSGWVEGSYRKMPFARAEVEAAAERRLVLPAGR